jgi:hypothetical protein
VTTSKNAVDVRVLLPVMYIVLLLLLLPLVGEHPERGRGAGDAAVAESVAEAGAAMLLLVPHLGLHLTLDILLRLDLGLNQRELLGVALRLLLVKQPHLLGLPHLELDLLLLEVDLRADGDVLVRAVLLRARAKDGVEKHDLRG